MNIEQQFWHKMAERENITSEVLRAELTAEGKVIGFSPIMEEEEEEMRNDPSDEELVALAHKLECAEDLVRRRVVIKMDQEEEPVLEITISDDEAGGGVSVNGREEVAESQKVNEKGGVKRKLYREEDFEEVMEEAMALTEELRGREGCPEAGRIKRRLKKLRKIWMVSRAVNGRESEGEGGCVEREEMGDHRGSEIREEESIVERSGEDGSERGETGGSGRREGSEKSQKPAAFLNVVLSGVPSLPLKVIAEDIVRNVDCGTMTSWEMATCIRKLDIKMPEMSDGRQTIVVRLPRFVARRMVEARVVRLLNTRVLVREFVKIEMCKRCLKIGHTWGTCKRAQRCRRCAGCHEVGECPEVHGERCANCVDEGRADEDTCHDPRSLDCPVFREVALGERRTW